MVDLGYISYLFGFYIDQFSRIFSLDDSTFYNRLLMIFCFVLITCTFKLLLHKIIR